MTTTLDLIEQQNRAAMRAVIDALGIGFSVQSVVDTVGVTGGISARGAQLSVASAMQSALVSLPTLGIDMRRAIDSAVIK